MRKSHIGYGCTAVLATLLFGQAQAQEAPTVSEVIVTAQKIQQRAIDVPISIAVFDRAYFKNTRTATFEDLAKMTPGLIVNESVGSSYTNVAVRGIGSDALNSGVEPSVGVYVDGVYQARPAFLAGDLMDIERVEVLRGPQGTLYGKNTDAGAINVTTRGPTDTFQADAKAYAGNFGARSLEGAVGGPITDTLRFRISAYDERRDGYIRNTIAGTGGDDYQRYGIRAALAFDPTDRLSLTLRTAYDSHDTSVINYALLSPSPELSGVAGLFGVSLPASIYDREAAANFEPHERIIQGRASLTATYRLDDGLTLTSISAFQQFHDNNKTDVDYTGLNLLDGGAVTSQDQISQELRLANDPSSRLSYLVGAFFFRQTQHDRGFNTVHGDLTAITGGAFPDGAQDLEITSTVVRSEALFGQATYKLTDQLSASLGLRYDDQHNSQDRFQPQGVTIPDLGTLSVSKSESKLSGSATLRYAFTPDMNGYATISRGFKGGGYNGYGIGSINELGFDAEQATNYEVGLKGYLFDRRLSFDAAVFYMKLKNLQVSNFDGANFIVGNAAAATTKGVEVNATATPVHGLLLNAAVSYDDATYDSYPGAPCTAAQTAVATGSCVQSLAGRTIANAPKWHGALSAQYEHELGWLGLSALGRLDYAYFSSQYLETALAPETFQKAYGLLNGRIGVHQEDGKWGLFLTAANLTNQKYLRNAYDFPLFNGAYLGAPGRPRTYGVELQASF